MNLNQLKINDKVLIVKGQDTGKIGIYLGKQNNANWNIISFGGDNLVFMNEDEYILYVEDNLDLIAGG